VLHQCLYSDDVEGVVLSALEHKNQGSGVTMRLG
jgi:hypothetical protein